MRSLVLFAALLVALLPPVVALWIVRVAGRPAEFTTTAVCACCDCGVCCCPGDRIWTILPPELWRDRRLGFDSTPLLMITEAAVVVVVELAFGDGGAVVVAAVWPTSTSLLVVSNLRGERVFTIFCCWPMFSLERFDEPGADETIFDPLFTTLPDDDDFSVWICLRFCTPCSGYGGWSWFLRYVWWVWYLGKGGWIEWLEEIYL